MIEARIEKRDLSIDADGTRRELMTEASLLSFGLLHEFAHAWQADLGRLVTGLQKALSDLLTEYEAGGLIKRKGDKGVACQEGEER